jgi:mRNA interferase MazF
VSFDPAIGGETKKTRLAVIVSNDASNRHLVKPTILNALQIETVVI